MMLTFAKAALAAALLVGDVFALDTISVKGSKFFAGGQQFFLKGVAYQGTPADPLVDITQCQLDATVMKQIGTNSIRVYHVDPWQNHDGCMNALRDAGIYVWLDLDTFNSTVTQTAPSWTETQFLAFAQVMDVFQQYDNLGGFWIGNEVINTLAGAPAAPYVKAAIADMKAYMAAKNYRTIPIGYSAADIAELRPMLQNYLVCSSSEDLQSDFFGLNSYEWCADATYDTSGYSNLQAMAEGYTRPIFFSETGCNQGGPRTFNDQAAIFGDQMVNTWSGSIIYEWVQETNNYGLVTYPNGQIYSGAPTPISPDFDNLKNMWAKVFPTGVAESAYTPASTTIPCPAATMGWSLNGEVAIPRLSPDVIQAAAKNQLIPGQAAPSSSVSKVSGASSSMTTTSQTTTATTSGTSPSSSSSFAESSPTSSSSTLLSAPPLPSISSTAPSTSSLPMSIPTTTTTTLSTTTPSSSSDSPGPVAPSTTVTSTSTSILPSSSSSSGASPTLATSLTSSPVSAQGTTTTSSSAKATSSSAAQPLSAPADAISILSLISAFIAFSMGSVIAFM